MTIDEIIHEFTYAQYYFPHAAVDAAIEQQEVITEYFLDNLQKLVDKGESITDADETRWVLFAIFLLAQFREQRAYPLIVNLVSVSSETADRLIGDVSTEGLNRILASVYDGNLAHIQSLVENDKADEFVRSGAMRSFVILYQAGLLDIETIQNYCTELFRGKLTREPNHIWNSLVSCCKAFGFIELLDDIRQAYKEELAEDFFQRLSRVEEDILKNHRKPDILDEESKARLIDSTAEELQWWHSFQPKNRPKRSAPIPQERFIHTETTLVRETAKTGRNDPCPCGSGKKFKKCCGR